MTLIWLKNNIPFLPYRHVLFESSLISIAAAALSSPVGITLRRVVLSA